MLRLLQDDKPAHVTRLTIHGHEGNTCFEYGSRTQDFGFSH